MAPADGLRVQPWPLTQLDLPYRPCVGIMLINRRGLVWVGRRLPKWAGDGSAHIWQMPQGGIAPASPPARRRCASSRRRRGSSASSCWRRRPAGSPTSCPSELIGIALKGRYRGQKQKWFAMRFLG